MKDNEQILVIFGLPLQSYFVLLL